MLMTKPPMTLLKAGVGRMMREAYIYVHGGRDGHGSKHGLQRNALVGGQLKEERHGSDGHSFEDGVEAHEGCRIFGAREEHDHGDNEATYKAEHCEGPDVQAAVAVVHGVQTKHYRNQSADHRQEEVANLSQATVNGHPVVAGQIAPKFLIEDRVTA